MFFFGYLEKLALIMLVLDAELPISRTEITLFCRSHNGDVPTWLGLLLVAWLYALQLISIVVKVLFFDLEVIIIL